MGIVKHFIHFSSCRFTKQDKEYCYCCNQELVQTGILWLTLLNNRNWGKYGLVFCAMWICIDVMRILWDEHQILKYMRIQGNKCCIGMLIMRHIGDFCAICGMTCNNISEFLGGEFCNFVFYKVFVPPSCFCTFSI